MKTVRIDINYSRTAMRYKDQNEKTKEFAVISYVNYRTSTKQHWTKDHKQGLQASAGTPRGYFRLGRSSRKTFTNRGVLQMMRIVRRSLKPVVI